jgi:Pro-kumamolisin, activation domain
MILPVRIGLAQSNLDKGHSSLMDVSDPRSPNYGKYWSADKVHDAFAPSRETVKEVMEWLSSAGIPSHRVAHYRNRGWLAFDARINEVESLLKTQYHEHHHTSGEIRIGADECVLDFGIKSAANFHLDITFHLIFRNMSIMSLPVSNFLRLCRKLQNKN